MATLTLRPNANGSYQSFSQYPDSGSHYDKVDEETPDEDATYLYTSTENVAEIEHLQDSGKTGDNISQVEIFVRVKVENVGQTIRTRIRTTTNADSGNISVTQSYANYSNVHTAKPEGGAWTWADIDTLQAGLRTITGLSGYIRVTQIWIVVTYEEVAVGQPYISRVQRINGMKTWGGI